MTQPKKRPEIQNEEEWLDATQNLINPEIQTEEPLLTDLKGDVCKCHFVASADS